jgi:hypothetical protein
MNLAPEELALLAEVDEMLCDPPENAEDLGAELVALVQEFRRQRQTMRPGARREGR